MRPRAACAGALPWLVPAVLAAGLCNACSAPEPPVAAVPPPVVPAQVAGDGAPRAAAEAGPGVAVATPSAPRSAAPPPPAAQAPGDPPAASEPPPVTAPARTAPPGDPAPPPAGAADASPTSIVVTMLSRGKGVPDETRAAYREIRAVLERGRAGSNATALQTSRIGLEGETRLCAAFDSRDDARAALAEVRKLAAGVDLLEVVEAPCPRSKESTP